jgi:diamine N-acetyltransferase
MDVSLREVTRENVDDVLALQVAPEQASYVATNAKSIAQAHFEPLAWFRAIYAGDQPVGFAMVHRDPARRSFYIWRFMVDARFQGRGYGTKALQLLLEQARSDGATEVTLSVAPGEHSALGFYERAGFEDTGEVVHDQIVMRLRLDDGT